LVSATTVASLPLLPRRTRRRNSIRGEAENAEEKQHPRRGGGSRRRNSIRGEAENAEKKQHPRRGGERGEETASAERRRTRRRNSIRGEAENAEKKQG
jgi:hypothetical protein